MLQFAARLPSPPSPVASPPVTRITDAAPVSTARTACPSMFMAEEPPLVSWTSQRDDKPRFQARAVAASGAGASGRLWAGGLRPLLAAFLYMFFPGSALREWGRDFTLPVIPRESGRSSH